MLIARIAIAGLLLGVALYACRLPVADVFSGWALGQEATLAVLGLIGAIVYCCAIFAPFGWRLMIVKP